MPVHIEGSCLCHIGENAQLVRKPVKSDGRSAGVRSCILSYNGTDQLTMCAGDGDVFVMAQMPTSERGPAFVVSVDRERFQKACACFNNRGGSVKVRTVETFLALAADQLYLPIRQRDSFGACPAPLGSGQRAVVGRAAFTTALELIVAGGTAGPLKDDEFDRRGKVCTARPDGVIYGACDSVVFVARGPELGFEISLRRQHAGRLLQWLQLLPRSASLFDEEDEVDEVEIVRTSVDGRVMFRFVRRPGPQMLLLPERTTPFACQFVDDVNQPFELELRVPRCELAETVKVFRPFGEKLKLYYSALAGQNEPLEVIVADKERSARDKIEAAPINAGGVHGPVEVTVAGKDLSLALRAVGGEHVVLALRSGWSVVTSSEDEELAVTERSRRAYIRARKAQPVEAATAVTETHEEE